MMITLLVVVAEAQTSVPMSEAHKDVATCFPLSEALSGQVLYGHVQGIAVFIEEESACAEGAAPTAPGPVVPRDLPDGRARVLYIVDAVAAFDGAKRYALTERIRDRVWWIAPTTGSRIADVRVDLDASKCPTVDEAERCLFDQVGATANVWIQSDPPARTTKLLPNEVTLTDVPLRDALRALWAPHERTPVGYQFVIGPTVTSDGMRFGAYDHLFELDLSGPPMEVAPVVPVPEWMRRPR